MVTRPTAEDSPEEPRTLPFTIDSHLLQELGERLVGRHYIALAELVKNAYDADANNCEIVVSEDEIEVWDDGHGMTFRQFRDFWMRIGTTNKLQQHHSRVYGRPLTGSKGIGRLAVQFLSREVGIITTSSGDGAQTVHASVNWDDAVNAGELTKAKAKYALSDGVETYAKGSRTGTKIVLKRLNHDWSAEAADGSSPLRDLAREVWMLQAPLAEPVGDEEGGADSFRIELIAFDEDMEQEFREQLAKVLDLWDARIEGHIRDGAKTRVCQIVVGFRDGDSYEAAIPFKGGVVDTCDFEIRVFKLWGKQPGGITVDDARSYFREFGGVHVYDGGFRLPFYGIEQDWLGIQSDHAHRLSVSKLLPRELNIPLAMHDLPTSERLFGVVNVNTAREMQQAGAKAKREGDFLKINIGRDRLVDNPAYRELKRVVRWSIDYYATRYQLRQDREISRLRPSEPSQPKLKRLRQTIAEVGSELPPVLHKKLVREVDDYYESVESENLYAGKQAALLAPLAAAGLASLGYEHESNRLVRRLERLVRRLGNVDGRPASKQELDEVVRDLQKWVEQYRAMRSLFSSLTQEEDREDVRRLRLKPTVKIVLRNTRPLLTRIDTEVEEMPDELLLPLGTMADWQALLQNVLTNASNATLDSTAKLVRISGGQMGRGRNYLQVSDTGIGVERQDSSRLFEPFERRIDVSEERRSLGLAGMGFGLTIVRMICETRHCEYGFVEPESGFATTFRMTWRR